MAGDVESLAMNNGLWHHAAASRALEQQLSPENGCLSSSNSRMAAKGVGVGASLSSGGGWGSGGTYAVSVFKCHKVGGWYGE